jgi:serine/threonine protein kinase/Tol biopolymer transport system component
VDAARSDRIRALYKAALERPAGERSAFVAERSAGDASLRESVEFLLSQSDATGMRADLGGAPPPPSQPDLPNGTAVGSYRLESVLGRGGMGTVYRAIDTKLHRSVAIKFLSSALADSQARRRFQQEAETASALNHPHIVTVHDVGELDGQQYLVSELIDGGTLNDWLAASRDRPWRQSVEMLIGVADAIAAAHRVGIVHRDVKPGNILIGRNGYAKLADFGLAKLLDDGVPRLPGAPTQSQSRAAPTGVGVVVGTVAYMSPEQAAGRPLDERTDVFSFGVVLYEALAGRRPFEAANDLELLKTIAHGAPPPLPASTPDAVCAIVEKALEKDPADRYQHMQDLVVDLRRAVRKSSAPQLTGASDAVPAKRARVAWLVAAGLGLALVAALVPATSYFLRTPPPAQPVRFVIPAPGYSGGLAISPDGQNIAYTATANGKRQIWVRSIAALDARALPGTDNADSPFWSPDGHTLAYYADGKLLKIDASGGPPQALADSSFVGAGGGSWGRDGTILFARTAPGALAIISEVGAAGGAATAVTALDPAREVAHWAPQFLPGGRTFVFLALDRTVSPASVTLRMGALGDSTTTALVGVGTVAQNRPSPSVAFVHGVLLYTRDGALVAQHFDPKARTISGDVVPVAENALDVAASDNGTLVYATVPPGQRTPAGAGRQLTWFDRQGNRTGTIAARDGAISPALSPDGGRLAFSGGPFEPDSEIWMIDLARGAVTRRTFEPQNYAPVWSPDGTQILFSSTRASTNQTPKQIYRRAANGAGSDELLYTAGDDEFVVPSSWSPDGSNLLFERTTRTTVNTVGDTWVLPLDGDRKAYPLIESKALKTGARLSPDGRWIAYSTDASGVRQIVVQPFPSVTEGQWQVSVKGGIEPIWRRDGRELYYIALDGSIMAVPVEPGATFDAGTPVALFNTGITVPGFVSEIFYDVTADGQRFIVNTFPAAPGSDAPVPVPITVVINGTAALEKN